MPDLIGRKVSSPKAHGHRRRHDPRHRRFGPGRSTSATALPPPGRRGSRALAHRYRHLRRTHDLDPRHHRATRRYLQVPDDFDSSAFDTVLVDISYEPAMATRLTPAPRSSAARSSAPDRHLRTGPVASAPTRSGQIVDERFELAEVPHLEGAVAVLGVFTDDRIAGVPVALWLGVEPVHGSGLLVHRLDDPALRGVVVVPASPRIMIEVRGRSRCRTSPRRHRARGRSRSGHRPRRHQLRC